MWRIRWYSGNSYIRNYGSRIMGPLIHSIAIPKLCNSLITPSILLQSHIQEKSTSSIRYSTVSLSELTSTCHCQSISKFSGYMKTIPPTTQNEWKLQSIYFPCSLPIRYLPKLCSVPWLFSIETTQWYLCSLLLLCAECTFQTLELFTTEYSVPSIIYGSWRPHSSNLEGGLGLEHSI